MTITIYKTNGTIQGWTGVKKFRFSQTGLFIVDASGEYVFIPNENIISFEII